MQKRKLTGSELKITLTVLMGGILLGGNLYDLSQTLVGNPSLFLGVTALLGGLGLLAVWRDRQQSEGTLESAAAKASHPHPNF